MAIHAFPRGACALAFSTFVLVSTFSHGARADTILLDDFTGAVTGWPYVRTGSSTTLVKETNVPGVYGGARTHWMFDESPNPSPVPPNAARADIVNTSGDSYLSFSTADTWREQLFLSYGGHNNVSPGGDLNLSNPGFSTVTLVFKDISVPAGTILFANAGLSYDFGGDSGGNYIGITNAVAIESSGPLTVDIPFSDFTHPEIDDVRVYFFSATPGGSGFPGAVLLQLDAVYLNVPEPSSLAVIGLPALCILKRFRRRRIDVAAS